MKFRIFFLLFFMLLSFDIYAQAIVADHKSALSFYDIPQTYIDTAKSNLRIYYGHTSHGSQIVSGMAELEDLNTIYTYHGNSHEITGSLSLVETSPDLGSYPTWVTTTTGRLDSPANNRNVVIWSWCGQQSSNSYEDTQQYLDAMARLEEDYPDVLFIYMTGHLDSTGDSGNLYARNDQIRNFVNNRGGVLFDFADIERYDPDGNDYLNLGAGEGTDGCSYDDGNKNWCEEWCGVNSSSDLCTEVPSCAHSSTLNCNLKSRAFWWMLARISGWTSSGTLTGNGTGSGGGTSSGCGHVTETKINYSVLPFVPCLIFLMFALYRRFNT